MYDRLNNSSCGYNTLLLHIVLRKFNCFMNFTVPSDIDIYCPSSICKNISCHTNRATRVQPVVCALIRNQIDICAVDLARTIAIKVDKLP